MRRIFVYLRNISEFPQSVRSKRMAQARFLDALPAAPGGFVNVENGAFTIRPGQIVRFPSEFYLADNIHRRPYLLAVSYEQFAEALTDLDADGTPAEAKAEKGEGFLCLICGKTCQSEAGRQAHIRAKHGEAD